MVELLQIVCRVFCPIFHRGNVYTYVKSNRGILLVVPRRISICTIGECIGGIMSSGELSLNPMVCFHRSWVKYLCKDVVVAICMDQGYTHIKVQLLTGKTINKK